MKLKEAREIIETSDLSEESLDKARKILLEIGTDEEIEIGEEVIDRLMAILDTDIDAEKLKQEACEDTANVLEEFTGEIGENIDVTDDIIGKTNKDVYEEANKLLDEAEKVKE
ncbi:hypothetical protein KKD37_04390 [Patescibacteria group bacterium]|nr:hypothetical protein [Patescibacteria group bacterium]